MSTVRLTAVGRLTAWFALLFAIVSITTTVASYALVSNSFSVAPTSSSEVFARLGLPEPDLAAMAEFQNSTGIDPQLILKRASDQSRRDVLRGLAKRSAALLPMMILLSAVGAAWLARKALRPVQRLTDLARGISSANLHDRIDLVGPPDELKALADTFDAMLERLDQAFRSQRLFAAYASHELRTPLAVLLAEADLVDRRPDLTDGEARLVHAARRAVDRTDLMASSLLALSRAESGLTDREQVDLTELAGEVAEDLVPLANSTGVTLELQLDDIALVTGDRVLLRSLIENLTRNAIQHNTWGGTAWLSVSNEVGGVVVGSENTGRALTPQDVTALTQPFVRGGERRVGGSGIGGAVVASVATAHAATVGATARDGGGLQVIVTFPTV
jgi:signal transduction histidine kinase